MKTTLRNIYIRMQNLLSQEEGQDLIEYALVVALIAFAATAGMSSVASGLNSAFSNIANTLSALIPVDLTGSESASRYCRACVPSNVLLSQP